MTLEEVLTQAIQHHRAGQLVLAETGYRQVLNHAPRHAGALHLFAQLRTMQGRLIEAVELYQACLREDPKRAAAHSDLGYAWLALGRAGEAIASCQRAIACDPQLGAAYNHLGNALRSSGRVDDAIAAYREAVVRSPAAAEMWSNLGVALHEDGQFDDAAQALQKAVALAPEFAAAHYNLGNALKEQARTTPAVDAYRRAVAYAPQSSFFHRNLLFALHYDPDCSAADLACEHQRWAERHAAPLRPSQRRHPNSPNPERRLRVGYVSPDFHEHPVARFVLPVLERHDRGRFEVFCYGSEPKPDAMTARIAAAADQWRNVNDDDDAALAERIRRDEIDVLVDLAAHTGRSRLLTFARKPAPVQVTYLAYCSTTGLDAVDYRLSDRFLDPPNTDLSVYTEKTVRLPRTYWCYPAPEAAAALETPAARPDGPVTFGCLNNYGKVSDPALRTWARILAATPHSRLLLHAPPGKHRARITEIVAAAGVDPDRVDLVAKQSIEEYFRTYQKIAIALDPFPFAGGTTTCDALWMGVPVVTLRGGTAVGRGGASLLSVVGHPELVAATEDAYVRIAVALAADAPRRAALHRHLREEMLPSPLMNAPQFVRDLEGAYREMWRAWCTSR